MGKALDGRSDVYGMGVLAYEMMTGRLPFPDAIGPAMLISAQLKRTPEMPSAVYPKGQIPREVDAMIFKMLEKDRANRFADVTALRAECLRILGLYGSAGVSAASIAPPQSRGSGPFEGQVPPQAAAQNQMAAMHQQPMQHTPGGGVPVDNGPGP